MKYNLEVEIARPVEDVVALFENPDNMAHWLEGFYSYQVITGERGQPGTKAKYVVRAGERIVDVIETILVNDLPDEFSCTYEGNGVINHNINRFISLPNENTLYVVEHVVAFNGAIFVFGHFMKGFFKRENLKQMLSFKKFVETIF